MYGVEREFWSKKRGVKIGFSYLVYETEVKQSNAYSKRNHGMLFSNYSDAFHGRSAEPPRHCVPGSHHSAFPQESPKRSKQQLVFYKINIQINRAFILRAVFS